MGEKAKIQKTPIPSRDEIDKQWYIIDARGKVLGRLASEVAKILRGKGKPKFTPHLDVGDFVIVINAKDVRLTGRKLDQKEFRWYSGYSSGLRSLKYSNLMQRNPVRAVEHAVKGMLPKNRLGRKIFRKLKVYAGAEHPHQAQKPKPLEI
ncbi:50S ribosomal protein L13 [bacterium]|nr:MAG: 50S ribosomal protein L13 [bacterium]